MIAVADILIHLRIGRDGHPVRGRNQIITRIVIKRRPVPRMSVSPCNTIDRRELVARKRKIGCAMLELTSRKR